MLMVAKALANRMNCVDCDDYGRCSGLVCNDHPLMCGVVKDLYDAAYDGTFWGDIVFEYEAKMRAEETPTERALRMLRESETEKKSKQRLMDFKTMKYTNRNTGKMAMPRNNLPCRYANAPVSTDKHGVVWPAGCEPHRKGVCPYLHPGEQGYEEARAGHRRTARW